MLSITLNDSTYFHLGQLFCTGSIVIELHSAQSSQKRCLTSSSYFAVDECTSNDTVK